MATNAQKKLDAAAAALKRIAGQNDPLAQKLVNDFVGGGFKVTSAVNADLREIRAINPKDGATIASALNDPECQALAARGFFDPILSSIGGTVGGVAGRVGGLPQGTLAATASGLSVTYDVLKPLFQPNIWIRVGEVALGIILIAVGVARLTNVVPIATKIAKAVA